MVEVCINEEGGAVTPPIDGPMTMNMKKIYTPVKTVSVMEGVAISGLGQLMVV